jgi:DNA-directed RNA polymerase subunit E'/Rpb7
MWDVPVVTDRTKLANRSVIVLRDKKEKTGLVNHLTIPDDSNVNIKETEKISKGKDLEIEVSRMWKVRIKIVPTITGALGKIKKGLDQNLSYSQVTRRSQSYRRSRY